ncbi:MAG: Gfo/Idh/MocA family oxidoreductase [Candidatus Cloacimonetes bacterium]|nr:Gfo/Idh/MocA family oxidoreductase [Candidatus Cloacimonadota bacterium]
MKLKYALIGCGRIAPNHIQAALENDLQIVALCDLETSKAEDLIKRHKLNSDVKIYSKYQDMIKEHNIDLIAIATESGNHSSIAIDCIKNRINLIIEKPISLSIEDADKIITSAKEYNVKVSACHQNRFNKSIKKIREAVEMNRFGKLFYGTAHIRWNRGKNYYLQAPWRGTWKQDGGALMNQCIHNIDLLRWMMGDDIDEVFAYTDNLNHDFIETEDMGLALIKFKNGSYGIIEGTTTIYPKNLEETLYIFGENGTVKAGGKSVNIIEEWMFNDEIDNSSQVKQVYHENPPNVYGFGHKPLYRNTIESILNNVEPYVSAVDGRNALELVLAIYKSAAEGKPVKLPLLKGSTTDFLGRF